MKTVLQGVAIEPIANVYFEGRCVSHSVTFADGSKKSVGVILPAELEFNTGAPEIMECVAGACRYRLQGEEAWRDCAAGESFAVGANSSFRIAVEGEPFHYICHFG